MFTEISEYIKLSLEERQKHLDPISKCVYIGGRGSTEFRGLLAYFLMTTIPKKGEKVLLCHHCGNGECSNPLHLYWGTYSENNKDDYRHGKRESFQARLKAKFTDEEFAKKWKEISSKGGKGGKGKSRKKMSP